MNSLQIYSFLFWLSLKMSVFACPDPSDILPCVCYDNSYGGIMDCSQAKDENEIEMAFQSNFPETEMEIFTITNNIHLKEITHNVLGNINFQYVDFHDCDISFIDESFFDNLKPTLYQIKIYRCHLQDFNLKVTKDFIHLKNLILSENLLKSIPSLSSNSLYSLEMPYNSLNFIPDFAFNDTSNLGYIDLKGNYIQGLNECKIYFYL